jgi:hypothetical protein
MTRRLSPDEARMLTLISRAGGSWCPDDEAWAEPLVRQALKGLKSKGRIREDANDGAAPMFHLTRQGQEEAAHG